ncbi:MAG: hypothetical protein M1335_08255, partial [Chloroflexi bacterium]|nr:hypothetical protein [Chloroflexota bacterium]
SFLVVNKVRSESETELVTRALPRLAFIGSVSENDAVRSADLAGVLCMDGGYLDELAALKSKLVAEIDKVKKRTVERDAV